MVIEKQINYYSDYVLKEMKKEIKKRKEMNHKNTYI